MEMIPWGLHIDVTPTSSRRRCDVLRSCPYPGIVMRVWDHWTGTHFTQSICWNHMMTLSAPFSMEYEDADCLAGVPHHRRRYTGGGKDQRILPKDIYIAGIDSGAWGKSKGSGRGTRGTFTPAMINHLKPVAKHISSKAVVERMESAIEPCPDKNILHWRDPVYNQFSETFTLLSHTYTLCGEKQERHMICGADTMPTCEVCLRMVLTQRAQQWQDEHRPEPTPRETLAAKLAAIAARKVAPPVDLRPGITTAPKPTERKLSFEEMIAEGVMELDPTAYFNRRNWGERRSGGAFYDPESGTQLKAHRGDWRHKRGGVNHLAEVKRKRKR